MREHNIDACVRVLQAERNRGSSTRGRFNPRRCVALGACYHFIGFVRVPRRVPTACGAGACDRVELPLFNHWDWIPWSSLVKCSVCSVKSMLQPQCRSPVKQRNKQTLLLYNISIDITSLAFLPWFYYLFTYFLHKRMYFILFYFYFINNIHFRKT